MPEQWSHAEVDAAVADYFAMLKAELLREPYNKSEHRRVLLPLLNGRSASSVELKHANISAVLIEMGIPYIDGYKPRSNYQRNVLPDAIRAYLKANPELVRFVEMDLAAPPPAPSVADILAALERPPDHEEPKAIREGPRITSPTGVNYLEMESRNRSLGEAGETFVLNFERARLIREGRDSLADRVEQISLTVGPAAGYDIRSFEKDGTDRYIEAKTTRYGKSTPFFVTVNEVTFSQTHSSRYYLYRVFGFRESPRMYTLNGGIYQTCILSPAQFVASPR